MATRRSLALAKRLWSWTPHSPGQRLFMTSEARVVTAACGRRWGKSESAGVDIALYALQYPNRTQWVMAPTADQTQIIMGEVSRRLHAIPGMSASFTERKSPYWEIIFHDGVGLQEPTMIRARTVGTTGRGLRGRKGHRAIVDEAAFVSDYILDNVIAPILADYDGQLVKISSPDGVGTHFHKTFTLGDKASSSFNPRYASFQFPTRSNPYIPKAYLENEQATKAELVFGQEYLAQFLDREGAVFRKVMAAAILDPIFQEDGLTIAREYNPAHQYVMGADWARSNDFTVLTVFDITARELVAIDRFNMVKFELQRLRLKVLQGRYQCVSVIAEENSIGLPNIEVLQSEGLPVQPFLMSNASKKTVVDTLALALELQNIRLINEGVLTGELMAYRGKKLPSGLIQYSAPDGQHDDTVVSLMLAVWGAEAAGPPVVVENFWK